MKKLVLLSALLMSASAMANHNIVDVRANAHDKAHVAKNVLDSSNSTRWANKGTSWIQFEFNAPQELSQIDVAVFKGDERKHHFDVEVSMDGKAWQKAMEMVTTSGSVRDIERYHFTPVTAKYVRVNGYGTDVSKSWTAFTQIKFQSDSNPALEFGK